MLFIKNYAEKLIVENASVFFTNIDKTHLGLGIMEGNLTLKDLIFNPEAFELNGTIPFKLISGSLAEFSVTVPWTNLFSEAVEVEVVGVKLSLIVKSLKDIAYSRDEELTEICAALKAFVKAEIKTAMGTVASYSYNLIKGMADKIIDNLQVSVKSIEVDIVYDLDASPFKIGFGLGEMKLITTNDTFTSKMLVNRSDPKYEKEPIYKSLSLTNIEVYIIPWVTPNLDEKKRKKMTIFRFFLTTRMKYLIHPTSLEPEYSVNVVVQKSEVVIQKYQVVRCLALVKHLGNYSSEVIYLKNDVFLRPVERISDYTNCEVPEEKSVVINRWWKYAIVSVIKLNFYNNKKKNKGNSMMNVMNTEEIDRIYQFKMPDVLRDIYKEPFLEYLERLLHNKFDFDEILNDPEEALKPINFSTVMFVLSLQEQKGLSKKYIENYIKYQAMKSKRGILKFFIGKIPVVGGPINSLIFGESGKSHEVKALMQNNIKDKKGDLFHTYIVQFHFKINSFSFKLVNDLGGKNFITTLLFQGIALTADVYKDYIKGKFELTSFSLNFENETDNRKCQILKSDNSDHSINFIEVDIENLTKFHAMETNVTARIHHLDIVFFNSISSDALKVMQNDFADSQVSEAADIGKNTTSHVAKFVPKNLSLAKTIVNLNVSIKSSRLFVPKVFTVKELTPHTST